MTKDTAFDRMADALGHRYRRQLLMALTEHNPQPSGVQNGGGAERPATGGATDRGASAIDRYHKHHPKLVHYGYIELDEESGEISTGPKWEEIRPLLSVLQANEDDLPTDWNEESQVSRQR